MKLELEVHPAQTEILNALLFVPTARFSDLNKTGITNDHFTFHIKRLVELGLVKKDGLKYSLTPIGKEFANRFDTEEKVVEKQAKLGVLLVPIKKEGGKIKYLTQQRLKQPYFGFWGWATGKIKWGEDVLTTAARELKEETNLEGDLNWVGIWHKIDFSKSDGHLLEDKFFFVVRVDNARGELTENFDGGRNIWQTKEELLKQDKIFEAVEQAIALAEKKTFAHFEQKCFYTDDEY